MSQSVSALVKHAEERAFEAAKTKARIKPLTRAEVLELLEKRARSTFWWLTRFGDGREKRPQHEIQQKELELSVMVQVRDRLMRPEGKPDEHR